jgi:molecular chaperone GrpE
VSEEHGNGTVENTESAPDPAQAAAPSTDPTTAANAEGADAATEAAESELVVGEVVPEATTVEVEAETTPLGAELAALRAELDERTSDLQRVTAEYANYRRRVERDRAAEAELSKAQVISALLPVLDDLDRAREHGDLVGPLAAMADQVGGALAKFGLTGFGDVGDSFDPTRHEAVTHTQSADVTQPTCVTVMRRGYLLGDRLLRPALVAVADPE